MDYYQSLSDQIIFDQSYILVESPSCDRLGDSTNYLIFDNHVRTNFDTTYTSVLLRLKSEVKYSLVKSIGNNFYIRQSAQASNGGQLLTSVLVLTQSATNGGPNNRPGNNFLALNSRVNIGLNITLNASNTIVLGAGLLGQGATKAVTNRIINNLQAFLLRGFGSDDVNGTYLNTSLWGTRFIFEKDNYYMKNVGGWDIVAKNNCYYLTGFSAAGRPVNGLYKLSDDGLYYYRDGRPEYIMYQFPNLTYGWVISENPIGDVTILFAANTLGSLNVPSASTAWISSIPGYIPGLSTRRSLYSTVDVDYPNIDTVWTVGLGDSPVGVAETGYL